MGYFVTDLLCPNCKKANIQHHEVGQPTSRSYIDYLRCPVCSYDPDIKKEGIETKEEETPMQITKEQLQRIEAAIGTLMMQRSSYDQDTGSDNDVINEGIATIREVKGS